MPQRDGPGRTLRRATAAAHARGALHLGLVVFVDPRGHVRANVHAGHAGNALVGIDPGDLAADGHLLPSQDRGRPARHRVGLANRLAEELRRVGRAAEEQALAGEVDRPQLHVGFEEEAVGIQRHAQ